MKSSKGLSRLSTAVTKTGSNKSRPNECGTGPDATRSASFPTHLTSLVQGLTKKESINHRGKLFVVLGRRTFSAAQNAATFIERYLNAIFVGEPTGSSPNFVGEEAPFTLPYSKLLMNVSALYW